MKVTKIYIHTIHYNIQCHMGIKHFIETLVQKKFQHLKNISTRFLPIENEGEWFGSKNSLRF